MMKRVHKKTVLTYASTEWSTVFDQTNGTARYYHRENFERSWLFEIGR